MGCRMSLKMHFLHFHLNFVPENCGAVSDEQGERFHQDIQAKEASYQGFLNEEMIGNNYWMFYRHDLIHVYKRKLHAKHFQVPCIIAVYCF